jgi:hypothetical protein
METILQIEINEIAEIFLMHGDNRISAVKIINLLKYKDPITYSCLSVAKVRRELMKLFPIHKNRKKNTTCFKISKEQTKKNRQNCNLRLKPFSDINIESYGISTDYFKKV